MKIIDKTPLVNEKGELGIAQRVQGMLKYGFNWPTELEAQKAIVTFFDRQLEKGYTLIRNMTLGASGITIPMILLGPAGFYVINLTNLRGRFEVRGDTWNEESGSGYKPASANLVGDTLRMRAALKKFIERQGAPLPVQIEPVLIAVNPGLHVESVRPAVKAMMIDGIKPFVTGLAAARPVLSADAVHEFTERIVNPRPVKKSGGASPVARPAGEEEITQPPRSQQASRARTIFDASEEVKPFNPADFEFDMVEDESALETVLPSELDAIAVEPAAASDPTPKRSARMTRGQWLVLAGLAAAFLCILAVFAYLVLFSPLSLLP